MPHQSSEKRRHLRIETNDIVQYLDERGSGQERTLRSKNISAGGILIETRTAHAIGETLRIEVSLSGFSKYRNGLLSFLKRPDDSLIVTGKVVRLEKISDGIFFIGLSFTDMSRRDRSAIEKYIHEHLER
jgi:c-di-GMP-binding flagellar brake protein YcgR